MDEKEFSQIKKLVKDDLYTGRILRGLIISLVFTVLLFPLCGIGRILYHTFNMVVGYLRLL